MLFIYNFKYFIYILYFVLTLKTCLILNQYLGTQNHNLEQVTSNRPHLLVGYWITKLLGY